MNGTFLSRVLLAAGVAAFLLAGADPARAARVMPQDTAPQDTARKGKEKDKSLPLETPRRLEFTTSRGSWLSVDVSPDGQLLVFDLLGDLYTLPITGGKATRLTSGPAYDAQPRFSPDGRRVVFVSDRSGGENVWIISLDLKDTVQVTKGEDNLYASPEWTPDGEYIVVSRSEGLRSPAKLWLFHKDGGSGTPLIREGSGQGGSSSSLKMLGAAFGPDPRYVWYAQRTGDWQYNAIFPQYQLAVYDRETGQTTVMSNRYGSAFRPALSPDGRWLVYGTRHDAQTGLRIRDLRTGEERWLAYPVQRDDQESRATMDVLPGYAFTPDSREIVVSYGGELWRVPVDGSEPTQIPFTVDVALELGPEVKFEYRVDDSPTFTVRQIRDAVPSPDGKRLAFVALDRVWVMDYPDGKPVRLTDVEVGEHYPAWSPDGRWIAYVSWSDQEGGHLWKVRASGGKPQRLTRVAADYRQPVWSPDGRRIVAVRAPARAYREAVGGYMSLAPGAEFVWVPAEGGEATVIAPTRGRTAPHFAGDPGRIYAFSPSEGLVSFRWDGTDEKAHLQVTGATPPGSTQPARAQLILKAPKGDRALAVVGNDIYVVTVPYVGGAAPTISVANPENASFPVRKLTEVGGQFPAWSADGRKVHWSIGNAHVVYDLDRAKQVEDSLKAEAKAAAGREGGESASGKKAGYEPEERRIVVTATRDIPRGVLVLRGGRVITMRGDEVIEDADLVIRDNRIVAVGPRGAVDVPPGARILDVSGKTIVPGFVDTHYHAMWLNPGVHSTEVWQYPVNLAYGVTTTRDPQTATTDVLTYQDRVETGELVGPRIYSTGPGVFQAEQIKSLEHARNVLKRYSEYYDTKTLKMYMSGNRRQRQWIIMAAKELGLMPTTEGGLDFKLELTHVLDGYPGVEHSLPVTPVYEDVVQLFARSGTVHTPTLLVSYGGPFGENYFYVTENVHDDPKLRRFVPHAELDVRTRRRGQGAGGSPGPGGWFMAEEHVFPLHARFARAVMEAGGCVGVGSHGQLQGLGYHWEMWALQSGGMREHDVLRAATVCGARAIGLEKDLGSIQAGLLADLVVLDRNPLEDIRNTVSIRYVMKNGRLYEGDTLKEIWPRERELPRRGFREEEPNTRAGIRPRVTAEGR